MKKAQLKKDKEKEGRVFIHCPFCDEKVSGTSKKHLLSNVEMHVERRHKEKGEVKVYE